MKQCSKCGEWKEEGEFGKYSRAKDGLKTQCKKCKASYDFAYQLAHKKELIFYRSIRKKEITAYQAAYSATHKNKKHSYRVAHKKEIAARDAIYRATHKEEIAARNFAYQSAHKKELREYHSRHAEEALARKAIYIIAKKSGVKLSVYDLDDATWFALVALKKIERAKREAKKAKSTAEGVAISDDSQKDMEA